MKMRITVFLFLALVTGLKSQTTDKTHSTGLSFSNGLSLLFGKTEEVSDINPGYGFAFTAYYEGQYCRWFGLEADIEYSNTGYSMEPAQPVWRTTTDGVIGFDKNTFPPEDPITGIWNPSISAGITEWTQKKRTGFLSIQLKPLFYLPTKKVALYLYPGISVDFAMHQITATEIVSDYPYWEDSFRETLSANSFGERVSIGFMGGIGVEKKLNDKLTIKAEVYNKIYEVVKFHDGDYKDWYINYVAAKVGITYLIKRKTDS